MTMKTMAKTTRQDTRALWGGILFSFLFTGLIWLLGGRLDNIELLPDTGASWYYWKLPEPTFWTRATAWGFYLAHQVAIWSLIYLAQKRKTKYSTGLNKLNWWALGANAFFIVLRLLQTHLWYDGLAQDVSIWSSQVSVIILLVWVLLMENKRRGLFLAKKSPSHKKLRALPANITATTSHGPLFTPFGITRWYPRRGICLALPICSCFCCKGACFLPAFI